jgi:hypothetical protein
MGVARRGRFGRDFHFAEFAGPVPLSEDPRDVTTAFAACFPTGNWKVNLRRSMRAWDWVLVHVGFAMSCINADEAARTLIILEEFGAVRQELEAMSVPGQS